MKYPQIEAIPVVVDLETIALPLRQEDIEQFESEYEPPSNYKDPEKIEKHKVHALEKFKRDRGFRLGGCQPICIAMCSIIGTPLRAVDMNSTFSKSPKDIVEFFVNYIDEVDAPIELVTFNGESFDIPILRQNMHIYNLRLQRPIGKWNKCDLYLQYGRKYGQKELCRVHGITIPEMDGSHVGRLYEEGRYDLIEDYCRADVNAAAELYIDNRRLFA